MLCIKQIIKHVVAKGLWVHVMTFIQECRISRPCSSRSLFKCLELEKQKNESLFRTGSNPAFAKQRNPWQKHRVYLGSLRHNFPRAIAAFRCRAVLLASAAAWRSKSATISVPSRPLAVPSNSKQWAKQRAAFPVTISSVLEPSKRRKTDSSVLRNSWTEKQGKEKKHFKI